MKLGMKERFGIVFGVALVSGIIAQFLPELKVDWPVLPQIQGLLKLLKPETWALLSGAVTAFVFLLLSFGNWRVFVWAAITAAGVAGAFYLQFQNPVAGVIGLILACVVVIVTIYRAGKKRMVQVAADVTEDAPADPGANDATNRQEALAMLAGHPSFANVGQVVQHQAEGDHDQKTANLLQKKLDALAWLTAHAKELNLTPDHLRQLAANLALASGVDLGIGAREEIPPTIGQRNWKSGGTRIF